MVSVCASVTAIAPGIATATGIMFVTGIGMRGASAAIIVIAILSGVTIAALPFVAAIDGFFIENGPFRGHFQPDTSKGPDEPLPAEERCLAVPIERREPEPLHFVEEPPQTREHRLGSLAETAKVAQMPGNRRLADCRRHVHVSSDPGYAPPNNVGHPWGRIGTECPFAPVGHLTRTRRGPLGIGRLSIFHG